MKPHTLRRLATAIFATIAFSSHAQNINPNTQINWPLATGNGNPAPSACTKNGLMYVDISTNPYTQWTCGPAGWTKPSGTGGGGTVTQVSAPNSAGGPVASVAVLSGGTYTSCPTGVTFTGGGGTGAAATVNCTGGGGTLHVNDVTVTNGGNGYGSAPAVAFTGGTGSGGATASARIALPPTWLNLSVQNQTTTPQIYPYVPTDFSQNVVLASPDGAPGTLTPRALTANDLPIGTTSQRGALMPDGSTILVNPANGQISAPSAGMVWPVGPPASIPCYSGSSSWCTAYSATNVIPNTYLPTATNSQPGILRPDGTSCTVTSGVLSCSGGGGGSGAFQLSVRNVTANTSTNTADGAIYVSSGAGPGVTLTLTGVTIGQAVVLANQSSNTVTIAAGGGMNLGNVPTTLPSSQAYFAQYQASGQWWLIGTTTGTGGSGITQLTGDGTAGPGSGSQVFTLANVNSNVGTFGDATHTVTATANAKGQITAISQNAIPTAATGTNGLGSPDNTTIKTTAGVYAVQPVTINSQTCTPGGTCTIPVAICAGPTPTCAIQQINPAPGGVATSLSATITTSQTTIPVTSAAGLSAPLIVAIGTNAPIEWVGCTGISTNTLTGCTRNYYTSSPGTGIAWTSGTVVQQLVLGYSISATSFPYYFILQNGAINYGGCANNQTAGKTCFQNATAFANRIQVGGSGATNGEVVSVNGAGAPAPAWTPNYVATNSNLAGSGTCGWSDYSFTGTATGAWDLFASNTDCVLGTDGVGPNIVGFAYNQTLPGAIWWDSSGNFTAQGNSTAQSYHATGSGSSAGAYLMGAGTPPSPPSNTVAIAAPASVPTAYNVILPAGPPGTTNPLLLQCTGSSTACNLGYITGSAQLAASASNASYSDVSFNGNHADGTRLGILGGNSGSADPSLYLDTPTAGHFAFRINSVNAAQIGQIAATGYYGVSLNGGNFTSAGFVGVQGDPTGSDPSLYLNAKTGGQINGKIGNVTAVTFSSGTAPSGACSGNFIIISAADGHGTWCNGSAYVSKF